MNEADGRTPTEPPPKQGWKEFLGGAFGAGLVLILLPSVALVFGTAWLAAKPAVGLPILAIFGITILFGALALVSTLFARLKLHNPQEALGLPAGSVRAAIALALIVLFALISVMLYESMGETYRIDGLAEDQKLALLKESSNHPTAVVPFQCPGADAPGQRPPREMNCVDREIRYTVHLRQSRGNDSADLAKQLLILIGTLMTSVTSFYFASRGTEAAAKNALDSLRDYGDAKGRDGDGGPRDKPNAAVPPDGERQAGAEDHMDGCNLPIENETDDEDLPPAKGGVAQ